MISGINYVVWCVWKKLYDIMSFCLHLNLYTMQRWTRYICDNNESEFDCYNNRCFLEFKPPHTIKQKNNLLETTILYDNVFLCTKNLIWYLLNAEKKIKAWQLLEICTQMSRDNARDGQMRAHAWNSVVSRRESLKRRSDINQIISDWGLRN